MPLHSENSHPHTDEIDSLVFHEPFSQETKDMITKNPELGVDEEWLTKLDEVITQYEQTTFEKELEETLEQQYGRNRLTLKALPHERREQGRNAYHAAAERILEGDRKYEAKTLFTVMEAAGDLYYTVHSWEGAFDDDISDETKKRFEKAFLAFAQSNGEMKMSAVKKRLPEQMKHMSPEESYAYVFTEGKKPDTEEVVDAVTYKITQGAKWQGLRDFDVLGNLSKLNKGEISGNTPKEKRQAFDEIMQSPKKFNQKYQTLLELADAAQQYYDELFYANPEIDNNNAIPHFETFLNALGEVQRGAEIYHALEVPASEMAQRIYINVNGETTQNISRPLNIKSLEPLDSDWLHQSLVTEHLMNDLRDLEAERIRIQNKLSQSATTVQSIPRLEPETKSEKPSASFWTTTLSRFSS